jgi:hypothetical protein
MDPWTLIRFNTHLDLQVKSSSMMCTKIYKRKDVAGQNSCANQDICKFFGALGHG